MQENAPDGFRFIVCTDTHMLGSGVGGFSRMAVDLPETPATLEDRLNIASMSKTLTAAAVLSTLQAKNLSPDALVAPFLPPDWTLHAEVKKLTFRDFLTHRTGFNEAAIARIMRASGRVCNRDHRIPSAKYCYRNINFATMRPSCPT
jgi:CubicO group peptidase (beta-lactamase class C family)